MLTMQIRKKMWKATGTKAKVKLPRMAVVLLALAHFLLGQLRLPNALYEKLAGKVVQAYTTGEHLRQDNYDMLLKWCLTALQMDTGDGNILAVEMSAAYSAAQAFTIWQ